MRKTLTIGKLAQAAGVTVQSVRYYEQRGLLPKPARTPSGYRSYAPQSVTRLRFIKNAQELGFTLEEIGQLLLLRVDGKASAETVRQQVQQKVDQIDTKLFRLQQMRLALTDLLDQCHGDGTTSECPILDAMTPIGNL
ncbi:MAG TPA: heavy metal-responsive transcriptional regulator [Anaerolineae bacterium]|nr:heavy metal-responsive transcriptional regulator [Anaerolineae bacterium]